MQVTQHGRLARRLTRRQVLAGAGAMVAGRMAYAAPRPATLPVRVSDLSLEEKIGQLFLLASEGSSEKDAEIMLGQYLVGSVYLSQDNLQTVKQSVGFMDALQAIGARTPHRLPIFAGCDQEGAWSVINPEMTRGPGNMALGATSPAQVEAIYRVFGRELRAVGIAGDFAPCADVNTNPRNPIIGTRSFGQYPDRVSASVAAAIRGLQSAGTRACAKHFPGHGNTAQDTHRGLATVSRSREELLRTDLLPFRTAVGAGVDIVMTAHLLYPALDPNWPATLSPAILTGLLRKEMGFRGVILTDSFSMSAIRKTYGTAEAAIRALNAGADLVMLAEERYGSEPSQYLKDQIALIESVRTAARNGKLPMERIDDAVSRVLALKARSGLFVDKPPVAAKAASVVGSPADRAIALDAARAAIVLARNRRQKVPLRGKDLERILVVSPIDPGAYAILQQMRGIGPNITTPPGECVFRELKHRYPGTAHIAFSIPGDVAKHTAILRAASAIVVVTENYPLPGFDFPVKPQHAVLQALLEAGFEPVVLGLRDPYELLDLPSVPTYVAALGYAPVCATAAVEVLLGERHATGKMPVEAQ